MVLQILYSATTSAKLMINTPTLLFWVSACLCPCLFQACLCVFWADTEVQGQPFHTSEGAKAHCLSPVHLQKKRGFSWSRQGRWLTTLRWKEKKFKFYLSAQNLAWNCKVSFKHRALHWVGLEFPELLMKSGELDTARKELPASENSIPKYGEQWITAISSQNILQASKQAKKR